MSIRHWHGVSKTSRDFSKLVSTSYLYCDNSYYLHNCSTCNSPLCLRSNNIKSVFDSIIIVVVVTPRPFIFGGTTGRQLASFFWFCVYNFLIEIIVYWFCTFIMTLQTMWNITVKIIISRKYTAQAILLKNKNIGGR